MTASPQLAFLNAAVSLELVIPVSALNVSSSVAFSSRTSHLKLVFEEHQTLLLIDPQPPFITARATLNGANVFGVSVSLACA